MFTDIERGWTMEETKITLKLIVGFAVLFGTIIGFGTLISDGEVANVTSDDEISIVVPDSISVTDSEWEYTVTGIKKIR